MDRLVEGTILPAKSGEKSLSPSEIEQLSNELGHNWEIIDNHHLIKSYTFPDFVSALAFVNDIGKFAEQVNHHPEITFTWGKVTISIFTHDVDGLREVDFFWAANVETIYAEFNRSD